MPPAPPHAPVRCAPIGRESTIGPGRVGHGSSNSRSAATDCRPRCRYCGSPLTAPESIERGYGYDCGVKNGKLRRRRPEPPPVSRWEVRESVNCPRCGAVAGERCVGKLGQLREANHMERTDLAYELRGAR